MKTCIPDFLCYSESLINDLVADGRFGTSQSYAKAAASFKIFLQQSQEYMTERIPLVDIDDILIYKYNRYLASRGVIRNSISFYNRTLRAIYNKAVRRYRIPDKHPFLDVYTGVDKTRNRAVSEIYIAKLMNLDLSDDKSLEQTRDLFIFSYLMRGIAFVDMAYLRTCNIHGNYIIYFRKKTGTRMEVRIEPLLKRLLNKYREKKSDFLLPILQDVRITGEEPEIEEQLYYRHYQARLAIYNRKLKELSQITSGHIPLTSYVSRHSWATAARNCDISMSIISEGLGHSSERMTRIYLGSFNEKLIDNANRKMIERIKRMMSDAEKSRQ